MAIPPRFHYWLVRLRALNRPAVWSTGVGLALLTVIGQQYLSHPEWLQTFELTRDRPTQSASGSELTTLSEDDLAGLAEIDNLSLLLNQLQPVTAHSLTLSSPESEEETSRPSLELPQPEAPSRLTSPSPRIESPFAPYLERTQFRVSAGSAQGSPSPDPTAAGVRPVRAGLQPTPTWLTPLGESRIVPSNSAQAPTNPAVQTGDRSETAARATAREEEESAMPADRRSADPNLTPLPWMVEGTVPGVNQRFIRTTPEMSPPVGTTGYTVPPTLQTPALPTQNAGATALPSAPLPQPAPLNLNLSPTPLPASSLPTSVRGATGQTPSPVFDAGFNPPRSQPEPAPFSVPRPPGNYTGGGYIHTFSDPNGP